LLKQITIAQIKKELKKLPFKKDKVIGDKNDN
jgi:hypothetical protein